MNNSILVICKGNVSKIPPVINYVASLLNLKKEVYFILGDIEEETEILLKEYGGANLTIINLHLNKFNRKILKWLKFRNSVLSTLENLNPQSIWLCTLDTAISVWSRKLKANTLILSV